MRRVCRDPPTHWYDMQQDELAAWVKETLGRAKISFAKASRELGLPNDAISKVVRCERELSASEMAKLAEIANAPKPGPGLETGKQPRYVRIKGEVAAGLWRDVTSADFEEYDFVALVDNRWPVGSVFGYLVKGESINKRASDGDRVVALHYEFAPRDIQSGDWLIVERLRHDMRERTVKRAKRTADGEWELWPFSDDPRYQEPLLLGEHDDECVHVIGYVLDFVSEGTRF